MTNQHPLTEEMMDKIHGDKPGYSNPYDEDDMRAAADWQLDKVQERLEDFLEKFSWRYSWQATYEVRAFVESFD